MSTVLAFLIEYPFIILSAALFTFGITWCSVGLFQIYFQLHIPSEPAVIRPWDVGLYTWRIITERPVNRRAHHHPGIGLVSRLSGVEIDTTKVALHLLS
jgi:hypothetical protein